MKLFPVVHMQESVTRSLEQAHRAADAGADGVYFIDHRSGNPQTVFEAYDRFGQERPDVFTGINLLGVQAHRVFALLETAYFQQRLDTLPSAVWTDTILEGKNGAETGAAWAYKESSGLLRPIQLLGGVAFKYTDEYTSSPARAAEAVHRYGDILSVVTTSGSATGQPPSVEKILAMKQAASAKGRPLAVASGISLENIAEYRGLVDDVLVASSVETEPHSGVFDIPRLVDTIQAAHEL